MRFRETQVIVFANQKGGCGKTSSTISTAAAFAALGYSACVVDTDPQCNSTDNLGVDPDEVTLRMSDELLDIIRSGSGQRDTKANELFHALVLLVYEVADELDPHAIPKRGRWGTPTARAYPLELKNAFLKALLRKNADAAGQPVDTAA